MNRKLARTAVVLFAVIFIPMLGPPQLQGGAKSATDELPPGSAAIMSPEELVKVLRAGGADKPVILYVGPKFLYAQAHIPGAVYIGSATDPQSAERLRQRAALLPKGTQVVLYCGCCPWEHCPNIRPAYKQLLKSGFQNLKALYLATSFGADWAEKGYPVEKGEMRP